MPSATMIVVATKIVVATMIVVVRLADLNNQRKCGAITTADDPSRVGIGKARSKKAPFFHLLALFLVYGCASFPVLLGICRKKGRWRNSCHAKELVALPLWVHASVSRRVNPSRCFVSARRVLSYT